MPLDDKMEAYVRSAQAETLRIVRDLCRIPAPSLHEEKRAEYCRKWFAENGFENVSIDSAGNVLAPVGVNGHDRFTVVMAHTDTVFPDTEPMPLEEKDGSLRCPGVTDDTANLAVLMICARYFKDHFPVRPEGGVLFVADSGEEGLGDLKGSRRIVETFGPRIKEFIALDDWSMDRLAVRAVGSRRFRVSVRTEGGHSFNDFGRRNAIHQLAEMITMLYAQKIPVEGNSRTTFNVGCISGGTSVNTIAQEAEMLYEYRSDSRTCLESMRRAFEDILERFRASGIQADAEPIGDRPCSGDVPPDRLDALKKRVRASMKETLHLDASEYSASTDCNIPLAHGIPAVCFGVCRGHGAHTREETLETASLSDGCRLLLDFLYREE